MEREDRIKGAEEAESKESPNLWTWGAKFAASAGLAGMICCVAPAVLFMFGLMGGVYAISFADFFYKADGSTGTGAWILRIVAVAIGAYGIYRYKTRQDQCSIDPRRKRKNLILLTVVIALLGVGVFVTLEKWSAWYFDEVIMEEFREPET
ncbi:MAG: hypothetical protein AAGJ81_14535 [Verrucomicrobiota bacterium]